MFRNDIYAKFADIFDSPEEPRAVFQPDGKIEFIDQDDGSRATSTVDVSDHKHLTAYTPSASLRRKVIFFGAFCVFAVILLVITVVNLALLVQNQNQIAKNSQSLNGASASNIKGAGIATTLNMTQVDMKQLEKELQPFLNQDFEILFQQFQTNIATQVRDHPITQDHINKSVHDALHNWGGGVLTHLKNFDMDSINLEYEMALMLSNLSNDILNRLRVELGFTQQLFQIRVHKILENLSTSTVNRLKQELEIDPVHLEKAVHKALTNLSRRSLALIRGVCEIHYEGKCYWAVKSGNIPYKNAESLCENRNAMAANIYDDGHYKAMVEYLRSKMGPMNYVWLGMTRDPSTGRNYFVNGTESDYAIPWAANYPASDTRAIHLGLTFPKNASYTGQGFFNDKPDSYRLGILCEL